MSTKDTAAHVTLVDRLHRDIFPDMSVDGESAISRLTKEQRTNDKSGESSQSVEAGIKLPPFDMEAAIAFQYSNEHHSSCIQTARDSLVGMGHVTDQIRAMRRAKAGGEMPSNQESEQVLSKVDEVLNPLCKTSWQETQLDVAEDFGQVGNGYFEIVRAGDDGFGPITGVHHLPAPTVKVVVEDDAYNMHYLIESKEDTGAGHTPRRFACFGDKKDFIERAKKGNVLTMAFDGFDAAVLDDPRKVSEVIHIRKPSSKSRWYGMPHWIAAAASVELVQMMMQHHFDFFLNRGVPELAAFFLGQKLDPKDWDKIEQAFLAQVGLRNSHKSIAANLAVDPEFRVQIEKLAMESKDESAFGDIRENLALGIVSAHRVPPLLAGIQIPGKLGATNELPNALMAYQALVIGPQQRLWQQTLGSTLGDKELGVQGLEMKDFEYRKITEEIDLGEMDTVARMRQSPAQAKAEGRDLKDGVKE